MEWYLQKHVVPSVECMGSSEVEFSIRLVDKPSSLLHRWNYPIGRELVNLGGWSHCLGMCCFYHLQGLGDVIDYQRCFTRSAEVAVMSKLTTGLN